MTTPEQTILDDPKARFLGAGAFAAAQAPSGGSFTPGVAVSFSIDATPISLYVTPRNVENLVYLLYVVGRWPWVNAFLSAVFKRIEPFEIVSVPHVSEATRSKRGQPVDEISLTLLGALIDADRHLKRSIATVLAEVVETALDIAFERAQSAQQWIVSARTRYGVDQDHATFRCEKFLASEAPDAPSGGVPDAPGDGTSPEEGASTDGDSDRSGGTPATPADEGLKELDEGVLRAQAGQVRQLIADLALLYALYCAVSIASQPHDALRRARDPDNPSWDRQAPRPDPKAVEREEAVLRERVAGPARKFAETLRDKAIDAPVIAGVLGELVSLVGVNSSGKIDSSEKAIRDQIYRACASYLTLATEALSLIPRRYNAEALRVRMSDRRSRQDRTDLKGLGVMLEDTPEVRAALWALRSDKPRTLDPLEADTLLQAVKNDVVRNAQGADEAETLQAAFTASVIESYRYAWSESQVIVQARQHRDEVQLSRYDTTAAVLSLAGLVVGSVAVVPAAAIGLYSLYHHAVNQFAAFNLQSRQAEKQLLQDVLNENLIQQVDRIVTTPKGSEAFLAALAPMVFDQILMHLPGIGAWYAASQDISTILDSH